MMDYLKSIGFYTLSDYRAINTSVKQPLARCELILTDRCNFKCPYCRGPKHKREAFVPYEMAKKIVRLWTSDGLINIRFSGGEPTLHPNLPDLIYLAKLSGTKRIAISTNGSAQLDYYKHLIELGANDFSISLDACSRKMVMAMSGGLDIWDKLIENITELSKLIYVTVGMVFNDQNIKSAKESVMFADSLGVSDIRVLSSAQFNKALSALESLPDSLLNRYPILRYRINNFRNNRGVRGLTKLDSHKCRLVLDDMAIAGNSHFPCIIYLREGGSPIGTISPWMRKDREIWCNTKNTHQDSICRNNCLDVCVDYNNIANRRFIKD